MRANQTTKNNRPIRRFGLLSILLQVMTLGVMTPKAKTFRNDDSAQLNVGEVIGGAIGVVVLYFIVSALIGPVADQAETADTNANVSNSAIAVLDLGPLFMSLLPLGAAAGVVIAIFAFRHTAG